MVQLTTAISSIYPNFKKDRTPEQMKMLMSLWFDLLKDFEFETILAAFRSYLTTGSPFAPTVADLLNQLNPKQEVDDAYKSFDHIISLIQKYGVARFHEAYQEMNELEKSILTPFYFQQIGNTPYNDLPTVRSQYRDLYMGSGVKRTNEFKQISTNTRIKGLISDVTN